MNARLVGRQILELVLAALVTCLLLHVSKILAVGCTVLYLALRPTKRWVVRLVRALLLWGIYALFSASRAFDVLAVYAVAFTVTTWMDRRIRWKCKRQTQPGYEQLLSTLAHEIRTPLTIMQTAQSVLMEQSAGKLNERQRTFMESIYINTQRLITFSEQMLTLIRLGKDWEPDLTKTIDLKLLVRQALETVQPQLSIRNQEVSLQFPALLSHPRADEAWIRQVLINLIHNASKNTKEGGMIIVSVTQDDRQVVTTVTDNGQGIELAGREALFQEFFQERKEVQPDGFGLGLSIVRSIIAKHQGKVYITSTPNQGTMVSFSLRGGEPW
ncbi:MAG: HAMP domain-containing histidine kinase [Spirochaetales bacterium]|nr:HAMP domain-containing histidine kinase [Spirochaetales bacterium]